MFVRTELKTTKVNPTVQRTWAQKRRRSFVGICTFEWRCIDERSRNPFRLTGIPELYRGRRERGDTGWKISRTRRTNASDTYEFDTRVQLLFSPSPVLIQFVTILYFLPSFFLPLCPLSLSVSFLNCLLPYKTLLSHYFG